MHDLGVHCAGKVFDRMSKGIREAPSKAMIGDLATESGDKPEGAFGALTCADMGVGAWPIITAMHCTVSHHAC